MTSFAMGLTRKKTTYINITPIASNIPRQLAIDMLHSHAEVIELNPLVVSFEAIKAPRDAPADEFYSTWYEVTQRIQYVPGIGKLGSGLIKFKCCFHDMPWGLQTHTYAPANVDMRNKWQICGNQPGEPPETQELGIGAPPEGLYLREDIEIKCNMTMISFVKKEMKAASKILVDRMLKKAELLDSGELTALMENGRLKTVNPADRSNAAKHAATTLPPGQQPYRVPSISKHSPHVPATQSFHPPNHTQDQGIIMELPGDFYHPQQSPNNLNTPDGRFSMISELSDNDPNTTEARWSYQSASTRPSSYNSSAGMRSPGMDYNKEYSVELPTMDETKEEHEERRKFQEVKLQDIRREQPEYRYNPQDYAQISQPPQYSAYNANRRA